MEKMLEKLAVEEQMRQAKEEEEFLIAMNKKGQADLLKAMSEVRRSACLYFLHHKILLFITFILKSMVFPAF